MVMNGCAKKEQAEQEPEPEPQTEQMEEAPVDTVAVPDTTEMEVPE